MPTASPQPNTCLPRRGGLRAALLALAAFGAPVAWAASASPLVTVQGAWVRATVPGQSGTGGFMGLTASTPVQLVGFQSRDAAETALHEMVMDGDVMRMRAVPQLALPAGQTVWLKPGAGGQHLMLMGLKRALSAGDQIKLTLRLRTPSGQIRTQVIEVPVRTSAPPAAEAPASSAASSAAP